MSQSASPWTPPLLHDSPEVGACPTGGTKGTTQRSNQKTRAWQSHWRLTALVPGISLRETKRNEQHLDPPPPPRTAGHARLLNWKIKQLTSRSVVSAHQNPEFPDSSPAQWLHKSSSTSGQRRQRLAPCLNRPAQHHPSRRCCPCASQCPRTCSPRRPPTSSFQMGMQLRPMGRAGAQLADLIL